MATMSERLRHQQADMVLIVADEAADLMDEMAKVLETNLAVYGNMQDGDGEEAPEIAVWRSLLSRFREAG